MRRVSICIADKIEHIQRVTSSTYWKTVNKNTIILKDNNVPTPHSTDKIADIHSNRSL